MRAGIEMRVRRMVADRLTDRIGLGAPRSFAVVRAWVIARPRYRVVPVGLSYRVSGRGCSVRR